MLPYPKQTGAETRKRGNYKRGKVCTGCMDSFGVKTGKGSVDFSLIKWPFRGSSRGK